MHQIKTFDEWLQALAKEKQLLLFVKTTGCSVCEGLYPQVEAIQSEYDIPFYYVNATEVPEMAGQLSLFTAPVVLLFNGENEYARFARFVQMDELKKRLSELTEWRYEID